jgi:UDP-N-acetylmuramate dehydrogenase
MKKISYNFERIKKNIKRQVALAPFTTMQVGGPARYFIRVRSEEEIPEIVDWTHRNNIPILVLGGGSNIIVSDNGFSGLVLKIEIYGIHCTKETSAQVEIMAGAGESWDSFVEYTVHKGWWGIENMSLIPGTVGAVPVQNVSAYAQESKSVINKVRAYDMQETKFVELSNIECEFGFRKSIFNTTEAGRYIIVSVSFLLNKNGKPNLSRHEIVDEIEKQRQAKGSSVFRIIKIICQLMSMKRTAINYEQAQIREAIITLRTNGKLLPPPNTVRNSGTFFRAIVIPKNQLGQLLKKAYKFVGCSLALKILGCKWKYSSKKSFKLPSRLLIEACGLDKLRYGSISLLQTNCAVLINSGDGGNTTDILKLIQRVRAGVYNKTCIPVPVEPSLVGFNDDELKQTFFLSGYENKAEPPD